MSKLCAGNKQNFVKVNDTFAPLDNFDISFSTSNSHGNFHIKIAFD